MVSVPPSHQFPATTTAVAPKHDPHVRPLPTKPLDQELQDGPAVQGPIDVGRSKIRHQQLAAAEHVQRQEAVLVVIAVKEPLLLVAVHRIVRGVKVQDQFFRRCRLGTEEGLDKGLGDLGQGRALHAVLQGLGCGGMFSGHARVLFQAQHGQMDLFGRILQ